MIVSISQPAYLPWLGYIERIALSDIHIVLDHVQFEKRSFTSRNKIRTPQGWNWLSVPVETKGKYADCPINQLTIKNDTNWRKNHHLSIESNYKKCSHFGTHKDYLDELYNKDWRLLNELCSDIRNYVLNRLSIKTKILFSSQMGSTLTKDELILDLCKRVDCTTYISGPFGRDYLKEEDFQKEDIQIFYHDYEHPQYPQRWQNFEPYMNIFDLLINCGDKSSEILRTTDLEKLKVHA